MRMKPVFTIVVLLLMAILLPLSTSGQSNPQPADTAQGQSGTPSSPDQTDAEGIDRGGWHIEQALTFGYRFNRTAGNRSFFSDLVNVNQGPRLLDQVLSMHSLAHTGLVFDDLSVTSFGWGGDPVNGARWSVSKGNAYNFTGSWRRDQNYFDYNLLANPLNPSPTGVPAFPDASINISPHNLQLRRRMLDMAMTILPQSAFSIRLGYSRNNMNGPSFSSFHGGTDALLLQPWDTTMNQYRLGLDFKVIPRTIISYDQFLSYFDNRTDWSLAPFAVFSTATGIPASLGLPWNIAANQPCAAPFSPAGTNILNPACSAFQSYSRKQQYHYNQPTEQLMVQSNYFKRVEFVAVGRYSSNDATDALTEDFLGVSRGNVRAFTINGPADPRRIATAIDLGATVHLTDAWRIPLTYRFYNARIAGIFDQTQVNFVAVPALIGGPVGVGTPATDVFTRFLGNKYHEVQGEIEHDFTKQFGARLGGRFNRRKFVLTVFGEETGEGVPEPDTDNTEINEYTGLAGVWFRSTKGLRANLDVEFTSADNFLMRISPRNQQRYRARVSYTPKPWAVASVYGNFWDGRNGAADVLYKGRNHNAGFDLNLAPNERYGVDLAYNFNLWSQDSDICFTGSLRPPGTVSPGATDPCATAESGALPARLHSFYNDHIHYGSLAFYVRPVKRLTANLGYSVSSSDGTTTILNALQPLGSLTSIYHQPLVNLAIEPYPHVTLNLGYNYWNYNEGEPGSGLIVSPRNFRANVSTLSLRYAF